MNDPEQAFRDALRRADTVPVPVPPIEPNEVRGGGRRPRPWRTVLAAAAALTLVAGVGIAVWVTWGRGLPAVPIAPGVPSGVPSQDAGPPSVAPSADYVAATAEVDIYSGRQNPVVELEPNLADELYALLDDRAGALQETEPPELALGFRGFVVHADGGRPQLRILPDTVYVIQAEDRYHRLSDPDKVFHRIVFAAVRDSLPAEVVKVISESEAGATVPSKPAIPSDGPEQVGDTATWELIEPDQHPVGLESTTIIIGVTRLGCNGGVTGELLEPVVEYTGSHVIIRVDAVALDDDRPRTCQGNDVVPVVVELTEPIGARDLVDAACLVGEAVTTSTCAAGPVRWTP